ncbi:MAG: AAA family ATPase [Actinomycetota bacterium]|nr:AAA family ATPase [Actinomycetota bacterium]
MTDVRFTVLGRVGIEADGVDVRIPGRRERAVLALLLAARGSVVPVGRLIDDIWGASPADSAPASLQVAISRLRGLVEPDRAPRTAPQLLVSSGAGYALLAGAGQVDAETFADLVDAAHHAVDSGRAAEALDLCQQADRMWSGTPFADLVEGDLVHGERRRLEDLRVSCLELRAEAQLALGRHALVTGELEALVATHPFRERLWHHYAVALYRSQRQADALDALRRARTLLRDELGVDPSPELQQLEADLLAQAPGLAGLPAAARVAPPASEPSGLIGRDNALDQLCRSLSRTVDDVQGHTVVVGGEAGIGKSRLVTELAGHAEQHGARVLWGRCHEADVSPAYWPWVPIVQALAGPHPAREIAELLDASAGTAGTDAGAAALRTYDAVSRLVASAAAEQPIVLLLEDVHWADTSSLQLLAYAAETLRGLPVLVVATSRTVDAPSDALQACLASLGRASAERIQLHGLPSDEVRRLVGHLIGSEADDELAEVVAERTDGNPFFVIELVRLLEAGQRLDAAGAREVDVPHGVQDVLRLRLARLPEPVRTLLGVAAVVGRGFQLDLLAEVASRSLDQALDLLDVAVASHAVEEGDVPGRYRFTHALVRETLYASLSLARRGLLHAAVAQGLEHHLDDDPDLVAELAHHFVLGAAMRPELAEGAARHSVTAARHAEGRGALDQALVHWEQALTAEGAVSGPDQRRRYHVLLGLGQARYRRADIAGSREALGAAMDIARELADQELMATAATSFRGAGVWHWREFGTSDPAMVSVLEDCVGSCSPGPLRTRVLVSLAMELVYEWRSEEAEAVGRRAVQAARDLGDDDLFADVVSLHTLALWGKPGAVAQRLELAHEALARALSHEQELYLRFGAAAAHLQGGNPAEADRQMTRCTELSRRLRHTGADVPIAWWRFYRAVDADDPVAGERLLAEALDRHRVSSIVAISEMEPMARFRLRGIGVDVPDGHVELGLSHANPAFRAMTAHVLAESGRALEGAEVLGEPVPDGAWDYASMYGDCLRVDVLAAAGHVDPLRAAFSRIEPWGHEFAVYGSTDCIGSIDYFVGRGHEGLGNVDAARAAYTRAAETNRSAGIVPWQLRAERRLAGLADLVGESQR